MAEVVTLNASTTSKAVADELRRAILSGEIEPGARIRVRRLTEQFGVSHIPIREALLALEGQGLVRIVPQRGAVATELSSEAANDLYDLRIILEREVAARAIARYTDEDLARIGETFERLEEAAFSDAPASTYWDQHAAFHRAILDPGLTPIILDTLTNLWQACRRYENLAVLGTVNVREHYEATTHRDLLVACQSGNVLTLTKAVVDHLVSARERVRERYLTSQKGASSGSA